MVAADAIDSLIFDRFPVFFISSGYCYWMDTSANRKTIRAPKQALTRASFSVFFADRRPLMLWYGQERAHPGRLLISIAQPPWTIEDAFHTTNAKNLISRRGFKPRKLRSGSVAYCKPARATGVDDVKRSLPPVARISFLVVTVCYE